MMNLFAYGTLQIPEVWQRVVGRSFERVPGVANGYAVRRIRGELYPGLAPAENSSAPGVVFLNIDEAALAALDDFENTGYYQRGELEVVCADGLPRRCEAYLVDPARSEVLTTELWNVEGFLSRCQLTQFLTSR